MQSNTDIYSDIFESIHLKEEAWDLSEGLDGILSGMYNVTGTGLVTRINNRFSKDTASAIVLCMERNRIDPDNLASYKQFFDTFQDHIKKAKIADLTLATRPEAELIDSVSNFLRKAFSNNNILISLRIDPSILGGIEFIWNGKYLNLSLEKKINEWFKNKNEII